MKLDRECKMSINLGLLPCSREFKNTIKAIIPNCIVLNDNFLNVLSKVSCSWSRLRSMSSLSSPCSNNAKSRRSPTLPAGGFPGIWRGFYRLAAGLSLMRYSGTCSRCSVGSLPRCLNVLCIPDFNNFSRHFILGLTGLQNVMKNDFRNSKKIISINVLLKSSINFMLL